MQEYGSCSYQAQSFVTKMLQEDPEDRPTIDDIMQDFEKNIIYDSDLKKRFNITGKNDWKQSLESDEFGENFFTLSTKTTEKDSKEYTILVYRW